MITISCSILEQVRKNHAAFAQLLAEGEKLQRGGTHGMFAYWQDVSKQIHLQELTVTSGVKKLQTLFSNFEDNHRNREKQEVLYKQFMKYHDKCEKEHFQFHDSKHRIQWQITPNIRLTGLTPWVFKKKDRFYAYFCIEKGNSWQYELKYPLLQHYMARNTLECRQNELYVGVYFLDRNVFEFKNYSYQEVKQAIIETRQIFENVQVELKRRGAAI